VFGAGQYAPEINNGRRLLAHELAHSIQQSQRQDPEAPVAGTLEVSDPSDAHEREAEAQASQIVTKSGRISGEVRAAYPSLQRQQTQPGPQSFAEAQPGTQQVDPVLRGRNQDIEDGLFAVAEDYYGQNDFRWFFGYAHAQITRQINQNLSLFQRPNELLRLNIHFAEEWLRAAGGQPHEAWREAFQRCQALQQASSETSLLVGELEFCGAAMANVHINVDLAAALSEVGCIPPADYGNMLVFVNRGNLAAIARYRGQAVGAAETIVQNILGPALDLDVKSWRNAAYQRICNTAVTPVQSGFPGVAPRGGQQATRSETPLAAVPGAARGETCDFRLCFLPLKVLLDRGVEPERAYSLANHVYIRWDGQSAGFTREHGETIGDARVIKPDPRADNPHERPHERCVQATFRTIPTPTPGQVISFSPIDRVGDLVSYGVDVVHGVQHCTSPSCALAHTRIQRLFTDDRRGLYSLFDENCEHWARNVLAAACLEAPEIRSGGLGNIAVRILNETTEGRLYHGVRQITGRTRPLPTP
jgi:hypothetical protein